MSTTVTVQFANDQTGKNIDVQVATDGKDHKVSDLVASANSDLAFVTEVQLLANRENVTAVIKSNGKQLATLDGNADNVATIPKTSVNQLVIDANKSA